MTHILRRSYRALFRTKDGDIVIGQRPNLPIIGFFACLLASFAIRHGNPHTGLQLLGKAFLFLWAYQELVSGVNLFRRVLGAVILITTTISFFRFM